MNYTSEVIWLVMICELTCVVYQIQAEIFPDVCIPIDQGAFRLGYINQRTNPANADIPTVIRAKISV